MAPSRGYQERQQQPIMQLNLLRKSKKTNQYKAALLPALVCTCSWARLKRSCALSMSVINEEAWQMAWHLVRKDTLISEILPKASCRTSCHYCETFHQKAQSKLVPKSFQAPFALLEVDILHVLWPSSMFAVVVPTRLFMFRLFPFKQLAATCISLQ